MTLLVGALPAEAIDLASLLPEALLGETALVDAQALVLGDGAPSLEVLMTLGDGHLGDHGRYVAASVRHE